MRAASLTHGRTAQGFVTAKSGKCICDPINAGPGCCFCVTPGTCGPQLTDAQAQTAYQVSTLSPHAWREQRAACRAPATFLRITAQAYQRAALAALMDYARAQAARSPCIVKADCTSTTCDALGVTLPEIVVRFASSCGSISQLRCFTRTEHSQTEQSFGACCLLAYHSRVPRSWIA